MGRPASMWLKRAYEILADGRWHVREEVLREMVRVVPPGIAYRRGQATSRNPDAVTQNVLIDRGARQLCHGALNNAGYIENMDRDGQWLIRMGQRGRGPLPKVVEVVGESEATHVLLPVDALAHVSLAQLPDDVEFVRM